MSQTHTFKNPILQKLHEVINTPLVANLKTTEEITLVLYPYVRDVINNDEAYDEAKTSNIYINIYHHVESQEPLYKRMDLNTSMCFTLFMFTYS
jgi:hypothetical protein